MAVWPPRQESNLYRTLRRRVHYPLCYEEVRARILARQASPSPLLKEKCHAQALVDIPFDGVFDAVCRG